MSIVLFSTGPFNWNITLQLLLLYFIFVLVVLLKCSVDKRQIVESRYGLEDFYGLEICIKWKYTEVSQKIFFSATFSPWNRASKFAPWLSPSRLAECLRLVNYDVKTRILAIKASFLCKFRVHTVINYSVLELQAFSSNSTGCSGIWESHDYKPFFQIQLSHRSSDSQAAASRAEFELITCSPKIWNNLLHEILVGTRRHWSLSPRSRPTLMGVAEARTLKLDFVVRKWQEWNKFLDTYFCLI